MDAKIRRNKTIKEIIYLLRRVSNNLFALFGDTLWFICFIYEDLGSYWVGLMHSRRIWLDLLFFLRNY